MRDTLVGPPGQEVSVWYHPIWYDFDGDGSADNWGNWKNTGQWNSGDHRGPLCYTINVPVTVAQVQFRIDPNDPVQLAGTTVYGYESGSLQHTFHSTSLMYSQGNTLLVATIAGSGKTYASITADKTYDIQWRIEEGGSVNPIVAGTSRNPVYWVLDDPWEFGAGGSQCPFYYSFVDIGCTQAQGLDGSDHLAIANAIFGEFADRHVVRSSDVLEAVVAPQPMTYWKHWHNAAMTVQPVLASGQPWTMGLLHSGDGRCGAWTAFFIYTMYAVGIDPIDEYVEVQHPAEPDALLYVVAPIWDPVSKSNANGPHSDKGYEYINIPELIWGSEFFIGPSAYAFLHSDFVDLAGVPAQGAAIVSNPASMWSSHALAKVQSSFFDPSYGVIHGDAQAVESFLQAFARGFGYDIGGEPLHIDEGAINYDLNGVNGVEPGTFSPHQRCSSS
ncbi:MAG: hypothetical protein ACR2GY_06175 [Phycisphaerales bacterium]